MWKRGGDNSTAIPRENIYQCNCELRFTESVIIRADEGQRRHDASSSAATGVCATSEAKKKISKRAFCLLS